MKKMICAILALLPMASQAEISAKELNEIASYVNQNLPMMIDSETRLDNVFGFNNTLTYQATVVNYFSHEIDPAILQAMKPNMVNYLCTNPQTAYFFENGVSVQYDYSGKARKYITSITISPRDCRS